VRVKVKQISLNAKNIFLQIAEHQSIINIIIRFDNIKFKCMEPVIPVVLIRLMQLEKLPAKSTKKKAPDKNPGLL
jgi:hypothetical protein